MAREFRLPDIGEGLTDAEIVTWRVTVGDAVATDQPLVEVETAKAVVEITSPFAGTVLHLGAVEGASIEVGAILVVIGEPGEEWIADGAPITTHEAAPTPPAAAALGARARAMPVVRRLAEQLGVDLATVTGTGPGGAITRSDVEAAAAGDDSGGDGAHSDAADADVDDERVPMSRIRKTIADHMSRSWREIPHVTVQAEVDASALLAARSRIGSPPLEALVARCALPALAAHPELNATVDGDDVVLHHRHHLGFAVDTQDGLIVVVVRDGDDLSTADLSARVADLADRAQRRDVSPDEVTGQTFTISNIGALGGGHGTPIIPWGTTAILSFGRAADTPVVVGGEVEVRPIMPIDLSYDHRVVDGGLGQRFLARLVSELESAASV